MKPLSDLPVWPMPAPEFSLDARHAVLVLVDMQSMFCRPGVGMGIVIDRVPQVANYFWPRLEKVVNNQRRLLRHFRSTGGRIVYLTIGPHTEEGSDLAAWRRRRYDRMNREEKATTYFGAGSTPHGVIPELAPRSGEVVLNKPTYGAFASTGIEHLLRNWEIQHLVVCGQATNVCVYSTASEAADRGFECVIVEDACAAWDETLHEAFLANYALMFGRVGSTKDVIAELEASKGNKVGRNPQAASAGKGI